PPQRPESQWGYSGHSARIDSLQRSSQRSARCTYSGHSTRLISAQGSRHIDRRAVLIAVIALDQSDRRAVPIAVIAPDLDGRTKLQLHYFFNTITSPAFNSSSILTKPLSRYKPGFSHLIRDTNKLSTNFSPPSSSSTAPQNTSFDSTFPTLFSKHTHFFPIFFLIEKSCPTLRKSLLPSSRAAITIPIGLCAWIPS
ncbi:hypothetical protein L249_1661, partial [Ophiocordyceps polyrhachis-furcata BCC 54312]